MQVAGLSEQVMRKSWSFMSDLLTLTNLPREVKSMVSYKSLFYIPKMYLLTKVTRGLGKYFVPAKSLILLELTNLPHLPPIRGYRGAVSNPPHTPYKTKKKGARFET